MVSALIEKLLSGKSLTGDESFGVMSEIFEGKVLPVQIAGLLVALRAKGETAQEIAGFARAMRNAMTVLSSEHPVVADTCGTGGDAMGTFNLSTAAALVAAGCGVPVAKHGNRSVSSKCGSADVLESCGVKVDMSKETAQKCLSETGITFLFAPLYHPAMKHAAPVRRELGVRTVFNLLGPTVNPARANAQVIGVPRKSLVPLMAQVLLELNKDRSYSAIVLHEKMYDEVVLCGKCEIAEVSSGRVRRYELIPKDFALKRSDPDILKGGDAKTNAQTMRALLSGNGHPLEDVVSANAALALYCAEKASRSSLKDSIKKQLPELVTRAREAIRNRSALKKLDLLIERSGQ